MRQCMWNQRQMWSSRNTSYLQLSTSHDWQSIHVLQTIYSWLVRFLLTIITILIIIFINIIQRICVIRIRVGWTPNAHLVTTISARRGQSARVYPVTLAMPCTNVNVASAHLTASVLTIAPASTTLVRTLARATSVTRRLFARPRGILQFAHAHWALTATPWPDATPRNDTAEDIVTLATLQTRQRRWKTIKARNTNKIFLYDVNFLQFDEENNCIFFIEIINILVVKNFFLSVNENYLFCTVPPNDHEKC